MSVVRSTILGLALSASPFLAGCQQAWEDVGVSGCDYIDQVGACVLRDEEVLLSVPVERGRAVVEVEPRGAATVEELPFGESAVAGWTLSPTHRVYRVKPVAEEVVARVVGEGGGQEIRLRAAPACLQEAATGRPQGCAPADRALGDVAWVRKTLLRRGTEGVLAPTDGEVERIRGELVAAGMYRNAAYLDHVSLIARIRRSPRASVDDLLQRWGSLRSSYVLLDRDEEFHWYKLRCQFLAPPGVRWEHPDCAALIEVTGKGLSEQRSYDALEEILNRDLLGGRLDQVQEQVRRTAPPREACQRLSWHDFSSDVLIQRFEANADPADLPLALGALSGDLSAVDASEIERLYTAAIATVRVAAEADCRQRDDLDVHLTVDLVRILLHLGQTERAAALLGEARREVEPLLQHWLLRLDGDLHLATGGWTQAGDAFGRLLALDGEGLRPLDAWQFRWYAEVGIARVAAATDADQAALDHFERAAQVLADAVSAHGPQIPRLGLLAARHRATVDHARLLASANRVREAGQLLRRERAMLLRQIAGAEPVRSALREPAEGEVILSIAEMGEEWWAFAWVGGDVELARIPKSVKVEDEPFFAPFREQIAGAKRVSLVVPGSLEREPMHLYPFEGVPLLQRVEVVWSLDLPPRPIVAHEPAPGVLVVVDPSRNLASARAQGKVVAEVLDERKWPKTLLSGREATEGALRKLLPAHDLLFYSGHGRKTTVAWDARLALADDTALGVEEVLSLPVGDVPATAVLIACEAAWSPVGPVTGPGVAHAFVLAGANEVIAPAEELLLGRPGQSDSFIDAFAKEVMGRITAGEPPVHAWQQSVLVVRAAWPDEQVAAFRLLVP